VSFFNKGKTYELQDAGRLVLSEDTVNGSYCSDDLENKTIAVVGFWGYPQPGGGTHPPIP